VLVSRHRPPQGAVRAAVGGRDARPPHPSAPD
jgi:hypothetical protein